MGLYRGEKEISDQVLIESIRLAKFIDNINKRLVQDCTKLVKWLGGVIINHLAYKISTNTLTKNCKLVQICTKLLTQRTKP
mgnify:CR=1 FL=1